MGIDKKYGLAEAAEWFIRWASQFKSQEYILGCGITEIERCGAASICISPSETFTPYRLIIPAHVAASVVITYFNVDGVNQFISAGAIPGDAFTAAVQTNLKLATVRQGSRITLGVTNLFCSQLTFTAAIVGTVVQ
jgi:hypothetical protein